MKVLRAQHPAQKKGDRSTFPNSFVGQMSCLLAILTRKGEPNHDQGIPFLRPRR
jgi:hypothetical protein